MEGKSLQIGIVREGNIVIENLKKGIYVIKIYLKILQQLYRGAADDQFIFVKFNSQLFLIILPP